MALRRAGISGVVLVALDFPGESSTYRSEEPDAPQVPCGRGSRMGGHASAAVLVGHRK